MKDQAKLDRMLRMLMFIAGFGKSLKDISDHFEISERTVYRYLDTFRNSGFIISQKNAYYNVDKQSPSLKALNDLLHFTEEEAYILEKAIHSIDDTNLFKTNLIKKLYSVYDFERLPASIIKHENAGKVHNIINGIKDKRQIILRQYSSANSSIIRDRLVEAFGFTTNYISVWCYEPESKKNKLFKTSRIGSVTIIDKSWQFESEHKEGLIDVFRISTYEKIPVKFELSLRAQNLLIEEYPLTEKYIRKIDESLYLFDGWVCNLEGVARFIMGLPCEVRIISPNSLKQHIKEKLLNNFPY
jgi:proteasome accessory factor C